jgi:hypothetical protein
MPESFRFRKVAIAAVVVLGTVPALAACSSSSSGGGTPSPSASTTASTPGAIQTTKKPKASGPAGVITAPASTSPTKGALGGSEVFPHIDAQTGKSLQSRLAKFAGVRTVTYYPQFKQLQIYFTSTATDSQKEAAIKAVTSS